MENLKTYVEQNTERFMSELMEWLRIPSVSAKEAHKDDMYRAANWIAARLMADGADKAEVYKTEGHPVVYGEKIIDQKLPTVLVYGHLMYSLPSLLICGLPHRLNLKFAMGKSMPVGPTTIKARCICM